MAGGVAATSGGRMIIVETPQAIVRRHIDQVRTRRVSSKDEPLWTDPGTISKDNTPSATPLDPQPPAKPGEAVAASPQEAIPVTHQHEPAAVPTPLAPGTDQEPHNRSGAPQEQGSQCNAFKKEEML
ncbi:hypothetical protein MTO96_007768 [Rhipicephalus appendiculatus]